MNSLPGIILILFGVIIILFQNGIINIQNRLIGSSADTFPVKKRKIILTIAGIVFILFGVENFY